MRECAAPCVTGGEIPVIIFAHGFSQPVQNYTSTLQKLAYEVGAAVVAPETSLLQVLGKVAGAGTGLFGELTAKPPTKMQVLANQQNPSLLPCNASGAPCGFVSLQKLTSAHSRPLQGQPALRHTEPVGVICAA